MMKYLSICSGIEAATVAWHPLGWQPMAFAEIEPFPSAVLAHHYPEVPNLGDFTKINRGDLRADIDLLVGGTPCQDFSVAGLRAGVDGARGNLTLEFLRLAQRLRPRWLVWENVPGVLSSTSHRAPDPCPPPPPLDMGCDGAEMDTEDDYGAEELHAFNCFLAGLSELGYGWAYRVLDAQYIRVDGYARAVPQRRRRVFVVGYLGDWRRAAAVLFEPESLSGHPAPRREAGQGSTHDVAPSLVSSGRGVERAGETRGQDPIIAVSHTLNAKGGSGRSDFESETLIAFDCKASGRNGFGEGVISPTLRAMGHKNSHTNAGGQVAVAHALRAEGFDASEDGTGRGTPIVPVQPAVAFDLRGREGGAQFEGPHETANIRAANGGSSRSYVADSWAVRRLMPLECERLQGFPDGYTDITWRGRSAPDGPRYKALGNSKAVNCPRWIGQRIAMVDKIESATE